jgi:D-glucuronyl C5-epimerase-like protein
MERRALAAVVLAAAIAAGGGAAPRAHARTDVPGHAAAPPELPAGRTVPGALRRALLAGHLDLASHDRYRRAYRDARRAAWRLGGARAAELGAVVRDVEALAAGRRLTVSRMPLAFLTLRRNTRFWSRAPFPAPRERTTFGRLIFQYYPGQGLQLQPLATFGRANALASACLRPGRWRCRPRALAATLDALLAVAARRGGFTAWEAMFPFGGAQPPWISGMTQGTAAQALARGARVLGRPDLLHAARDAARAFDRPPPTGVAVRAPGGRQYLMYSTLPALRILNGHLQAVIGLRDLAVLGGGARARRAYRRGEGAARAQLRSFDTGAWSLYSAGGAESDLGYHRLVAGLVSGLCRRTHRDAYCDGSARFARYLREPPRVRLAPLRHLRPGRTVPLAFTLSKISDVDVVVRDRRGVVLTTRLRLPRGPHAVSWRPARGGRYRVRLTAIGLSGPKATVDRRVRVHTPRRRKPAPRRAPAAGEEADQDRAGDSLRRSRRRSPSMSRFGTRRPTLRGSHQARRPSSAMTAGTSVIRTTNASASTPNASERPIDFTIGSSSRRKAPKTAVMMTAAAVTTRPLPELS